jgi:hypothetical protein
MNKTALVTIASILSEPNTLVIYRNSGDEIIVRINKQIKSISSSKKLEEYEINFIKEKYL